MDAKCKRISREKSKEASARAKSIHYRILEEVNKKYKFSFEKVGSGATGTILGDEGAYDLDYNVILTKGSKILSDVGKFETPTEIKNFFYGAIEKQLEKDEKIKSSSTAITVTKLKENGKEKFHIDFAIIDGTTDKKMIIRRNNDKEKPHYNQFTWNEMPDPHIASKLFNEIPNEERQKLINEVIIPAKCEEKRKNDNNKTKITSSEVFVVKVMEYANKRKNN